MVTTDECGDYQEVYRAISDPQIVEYMELRESLGYKSPLLNKLWLRKLHASTLPFSPNLTAPEYLPSQSLQFLKVLRDYFPRHQLCLSDFYVLPEAIEGVDAPVVQTRYQGTMVPCSTYLVQPGWFDIFFPTNFELMQQMYEAVYPGATSKVLTQRDFLTKYSKQLNATQTKSGDNPMLSFYENFKFILTKSPM